MSDPANERRAAATGRPLALIIANCQGPPLRQFLARLLDFDVVAAPPVHLLRGWDQGSLQYLIDRADVVIAQDLHAKRYEQWRLSSEQLRERRPDAQTLLFPVAHWAGHTPELEYLRTENGRKIDHNGLVYMDRYVVECARNGVSTGACAEMITSRVWTTDAVRRKAAESMLRLKEREKRLDITISDLIEEHASSQRLFHTFNHPSNFLLSELAQRIARKLGSDATVGTTGREFLDTVSYPLRPEVQDAFGLSADRDTYLFAGQDYDVKSFVEACYAAVREAAPSAQSSSKPEDSIVEDLEPRAQEVLAG
jgi:hypothetical protein